MGFISIDITIFLLVLLLNDNRRYLSFTFHKCLVRVTKARIPRGIKEGNYLTACVEWSIEGVGLPSLAAFVRDMESMSVAKSGLVVRRCFSALHLLAFSPIQGELLPGTVLLPNLQTSDRYHQHQMAGKSVEMSKCRRRELCAGLGFSDGSKNKKKGMFLGRYVDVKACTTSWPLKICRAMIRQTYNALFFPYSRLAG